jgi:2-C-methyl-D-erythritol 4-phosphate cytidylyltransferase
MISAIIVAAGRGTRMGEGVDKLFLAVAGKPVVGHAWGIYDAAPFIDEIVLVIREERRGLFEELGKRLGYRKPYRFVSGGEERQDSVWNGLAALDPAADLVAIHDGARPCTPRELVWNTLEKARVVGAAVAARRLTDTVKESGDGTRILRTLDRARLWTVQTPQAFQVSVIRRALLKVREGGLKVTDDTAACECIGQPVSLVESASLNPKVTVAADLALVAALLDTALASPGGADYCSAVSSEL